MQKAPIFGALCGILPFQIFAIPLHYFGFGGPGVLLSLYV
jgi:hypothetical protein